MAMTISRSGMASTGLLSGSPRRTTSRRSRRHLMLVWLFVAYVAVALTCMAVQMVHPPADADLVAYSQF